MQRSFQNVDAFSVFTDGEKDLYADWFGIDRRKFIRTQWGVARPHNFDGLNPPDNLTVLFNLPPEEAWGVVWHADFALIPLRSQETPCGLVTLVGGMHLGKAQIVTKAMGVSDYINDDETGLLVPANDAAALAAAITRMHKDPALAAQLGSAAKTYAADNCSEAATVAFFKDVLGRWFG